MQFSARFGQHSEREVATDRAIKAWYRLPLHGIDPHGRVTWHPHPAAKALYFTVKDLDAVFARAKELGCLSRDDVHGVSGGSISVRPWGERSFYAEDKWQNPLCFVEAGTIYPG